MRRCSIKSSLRCARPCKCRLTGTDSLHLLQKWYREAKHPMQIRSSRDILKTLIAISDYAEFRADDAELLDEACSCYFVDTGAPQ